MVLKHLTMQGAILGNLKLIFIHSPRHPYEYYYHDQSHFADGEPEAQHL